MKNLQNLDPLKQIFAQIMGYHHFEEEVHEYEHMTKQEREENKIKLRELADRIYLKYAGKKIPEDVEILFKRRAYEKIRSSGTCTSKRADKNSPGKVTKLSFQEELFFHPRDLISVMKHELAHLYEIEEFGRTNHGKNFKKLLNEKFKLPYSYIVSNPRCLERRLKFWHNQSVLLNLDILDSQFSKK